MKTQYSLVSVIIPTYNISTYIKECLKSVASQTYANIEIIVVDDASTDDTLHVCQRFAELDNRVKAYCLEEKRGVSYARNFGLAKANGKFVMFVDGDDVIHPNAISLLVNDFCIYENICMSSFELTIFQDNSTSFFDKKEKDYFKIITCQEQNINLLFWQINCSACAKLFLKEKIKEYFPVSVSINEDRYFLFSFLLNNSDSICSHNIKYYGVRERPQSSCRSSFSNKNYDMLKIADKIYENVASFQNLIQPANYNRIKTYLMFIKYALRSKGWKTNIAVCKKCVSKINLFIHDDYCKLGKHRIEIYLLNISIYVYKFCLFLFDKITCKKIY